MKQVLLYTFLLATAIQFFFWLYFFSRLAFLKLERSAGRSFSPSPVSVIICAKNEAKNIRRNLPYILEQDYPNYEVIVVNDHSSDNSLEVLLDIQKNYSKLRVVNLPLIYGDRRGKKAALSHGILLSRHQVLLLTDADCRPVSKRWISLMAASLQEGVDIGLGYGPYFHAPGWLNRFIRFDTVYTAVQYFGFALAGWPYMGVGRNLIYRKKVFEQAGGFSAHAGIASGDDDLFVNAVAGRRNTALALHPASFTYSFPKKSWKAFYRQKARHVTTGRHYKPFHKWLLGLLVFSHFWHYFSGFTLMFFESFLTIAIISLIARYTLICFFYFFILKKLKEPGLWGWVPVLDFMNISFFAFLSRELFNQNQNYWT